MRVLVIDDHPLILSALQSVVEAMGERGAVTVTGVAGARGARDALAADDSFDLVLLDLRLGDADGFALLGELRNGWPAIPVVVVSASDHEADVLRAIDLGAMGFVPKRASNETLTDALRVVLSGGIYVPSTTAAVDARAGDAVGGASANAGRALAESPGSSGVVADAHAVPPDALARFKLTPRQRDVLALLLRGQPNKLIARELDLSVETVKDHVAAVLRALGVHSRTQAVLAVAQLSSQGAIAPWLTRPH